VLAVAVMTRRLAVVALVLALVLALAAPAAAQFATYETVTIKGANGVIFIPQNWNGSLFIYAHGYSADARILAPFPADPAEFARVNLLYQAVSLPTIYGYASATTTFRSVGWYVKDAVKDVENLRRHFVKKYGKPEHTYMWGHSGGGMVTSAVIERFPDTYDGALPMCGPGAGARRNFNGAFDLRAVYEWVCRDVPEARFVCGVCSGGSARCLVDADCSGGQTCSGREDPPPPEDGLTAECTDFLLAHPEKFAENPTAPGGDFVADTVAPCFGDLTDAAARTPEQQARFDFYVRATQLPESFVGTDLFFASIGMAEVVHRRTRGRHAWGNIDVDYVSPQLSPAEQAALNAGVIRVREDAAAVRYLHAWYEPRGRTRSKVLTVHALDDGLVIPENETKYAQAFASAGRSDQLVQAFTASGGHCGFIGAIFPGLQAITAWVEQGQKPTREGLLAACPTCDFTLADPGPWGVRVVERRQKTVAIRSLPCTGLPGDCPEGTTCDTARKRCRA
jgi:pimeloyl-ACP methyl ester carboxylesterase